MSKWIINWITDTIQLPHAAHTLTHSLVVRICVEPFHHVMSGAGRLPVTSHLKSYEWFVDKYFTSWSSLIVNGRTKWLRERKKEKRESFGEKKVCKRANESTYSSNRVWLNSLADGRHRCSMPDRRSYYANPYALIYVIVTYSWLSYREFELTSCSGVCCRATKSLAATVDLHGEKKIDCWWNAPHSVHWRKWYSINLLAHSLLFCSIHCRWIRVTLPFIIACTFACSFLTLTRYTACVSGRGGFKSERNWMRMRWK